MQVIKFEEATPYEPPGHSGVVNRLLVGRASGGVDDVSVWHGVIEPGGRADPHVHEGAVQAYIVVSGTLTVVGGEDGGVELTPGDTAIFAAGEPHEVYNAGDSVAALHVVSAPALR